MGIALDASDFRFAFIAEVICEDPHSSGFMVESPLTDHPVLTNAVRSVKLGKLVQVLQPGKDLNYIMHTYLEFTSEYQM